MCPKCPPFCKESKTGGLERGAYLGAVKRSTCQHVRNQGILSNLFPVQAYFDHSLSKSPSFFPPLGVGSGGEQDLCAFLFVVHQLETKTSSWSSNWSMTSGIFLLREGHAWPKFHALSWPARKKKVISWLKLSNTRFSFLGINWI